MNAISLWTRLFLLSLLLLPAHCTCVRAQTTVLDSLKAVLPLEKDPLRRIDLHGGILRQCIFYGDFEQGKEHIDEIAKLSREAGYIRGEIQALLFQARYLEEEGDPDFMEAFTAAKHLAQQHGDQRALRSIISDELLDLYDAGDITGYEQKLNEYRTEYPPKTPGQRASFLCSEADLHLLRGEDSLALANYLRALPLYDEHSRNPPVMPELGRPSVLHNTTPYVNQAKLLVEMSRLTMDMGDFGTSIDYLERAQTIFTDAEADAFVSWTLIDLSEAYAAKGEMEKAATTAQQALATFERLGRQPDLADAYQTLGLLYYEQEDYAAAERFFLKGYAIAEPLNDHTVNWEFSEALYALYTQTEQAGKAQTYLEKGLEIARDSQDETLIGPALANLGRGLVQNNRYEQAIPYLLEARTITEQMNDPSYVFAAVEGLTQAYLGLTRLDSAAHYLAATKAITDAHFNIVQKQTTAALAVAVAEAQKDYKAALAELKVYNTYSKQLFSGAAQGKLKAEEVRQNVNDINKEKALAEQQAALLSERNQLYLALTLVLLGLLIFAAYAYRQIRKVKQQLEAQNQQLEQLNATKDKFFGIIAHDIRSPIVALDGVGEQMSYYLEKGKTDKLERLAGRVNGTAKRLSSLLDNLLNWALLQQGVIPYHPKAINITDIGNDIFEMFRSNAEVKNISLRLEVEDGLKVHADEAALQTILRNLVSNAIKFTPEGGKVSIRTENKGDKVFITVNDTGTGISAEKMKQLFTLEKTSEPGTAGEKGTGLGLTLVKELTELNKGSLRVSSEPLVGSEFRISLPAES